LVQVGQDTNPVLPEHHCIGQVVVVVVVGTAITVFKLLVEMEEVVVAVVALVVGPRQ
jgi:hypothetical protein